MSSTSSETSEDWPNEPKEIPKEILTYVGLDFLPVMKKDRRDLVPSKELRLAIPSKYPKLIFDSHCHLDRVFRQAFGLNILDDKNKMENPIKYLAENYHFFPKEKFRGCINNITCPKYFEAKKWEWMLLNEVHILQCFAGIYFLKISLSGHLVNFGLSPFGRPSIRRHG